MVAYWNRWLRGLRRRLGQLVGRSRGSEERLSVAVDELPTHNYYVLRHRTFSDGSTDDVWRLVHRDQLSTASRPRSADDEVTFAVADTWTGSVSSTSRTVADKTFTASIDLAGYSDCE